MKNILLLFFLVAGIQLEANAIKIKQDKVTYEFDLSSKTAEVIEVDKDVNGSLTIPEQIDMTYFAGPVVRIADNVFKDFQGLKSVTLPETVTYIGKSAFSGCKNLESVNIPHGVKQIESNTFFGCESLSSIVIPSGVESIGSLAFNACLHLTSINIPETVKRIGQYALANTALTTVKIEVNGETSIDDNAFFNCLNLKTIEIGDGVVSIGASAFDLCRAAESVVIGNQVKTIGAGAFENCDKLSRIKLGERVETIGENAFRSTQLKEVHISNLQAWFNITFNGIGSNELGIWGLGANPLAIAHHLFINDEEVKNLVVPEGVAKLTDGLFNGCKSLASISIPESVKTIGQSTFLGCTDLADIYVHSSTPTEISEYTFDPQNYQNATLHVPSGSLENYATAQYWNRFIHVVDDLGTSSILSPTTSEEPLMIFDTNGNRLTRLTRGINIVMDKNGKTTKRFVRIK